MAFKNYSTTIGVHKTIGEIQQILVENGARKILYDYSNIGQIETISFILITPHGERAVRLPARPQNVYEILKNQKFQKKITIKVDYEQAQRVAWRNLKDWLSAQMALIESDQTCFNEIFLPYMLDNKGKTFFEAYEQLLLENGDND